MFPVIPSRGEKVFFVREQFWCNFKLVQTSLEFIPFWEGTLSKNLKKRYKPMLLLAEQHGRKVHELLTSQRCILVWVAIAARGRSWRGRTGYTASMMTKWKMKRFFLETLKGQKPDTHRSRIERVGKDR